MSRSRLSVEKSRVAITAHRNPGGPEHITALQDFWSARAIELIKDCQARSPQWTPEQVAAVTAVVGGEQP